MPKLEIALTGMGFDQIVGGNDFDLIVGGNGSDELRGNNGFNIVFGDDFGIVGTLFEFAKTLIDPFDSLVASAAEAVVKAALAAAEGFFSGLGGDDLLANKDDYIGGTGHDIVFGGDGPDTLQGDPVGATEHVFDLLVGGIGDDDIYFPELAGRRLDG